MNESKHRAWLSLGVAVVAGALWASPVAGAGTGAPRIAPPVSHAYGASLTEWLSTYWRWYYSGADPVQSVVGRVQLMPLPAGNQVGGNWTPTDPAILVGELDITLCPGTPFVLPLVGWIGERYEGYPATPDDLAIPKEVLLGGVSPNLTIDGRLVVSDANEAAFYVGPTAFEPIVEYPTPSSYGSVAAVFFQGTGIVSPPLPVGKHEMHLYEPYLINWPPYVFGMVFDNTWNITVSPHCGR